jgi:hypothetical protein
MPTTIKSTRLDYDNIKSSLKSFLEQTDDFADYNFEASGLSALLDVLAYNTHYNGLIANYALNESFLSTAQLRSSVVGLAASLGYVPTSRTGAVATINLSVTDAAGPTTRTLGEGFTFSATVDSTTYTFRTTETLTATKNTSGVYNFEANGSTNVTIREGVSKTKTFIAGPTSENEVYVIPDVNLDLNTVVVKVFDTPSSTTSTTYTNINEATAINSTSTIYLLRESPNGFFELTFSNGSNLGQTPPTGGKIQVTYLTSAGADANGARTFTANGTIDGLTATVSTVNNAAGGSSKETLESIRKNAPFLFASQNRMVTAEDYAAIALRNYGSVISDIKAWGGEDNVPPKYGTVYLSIVFKNGTSSVSQTATKSGIQSLGDQISIASFNIEFTDPVETFIRVNTTFQFNPNLTSSTKSTVESQVTNVVEQYFTDNLGGFDESFRRSNLLTLVDEVDAAVLSSRADIKMIRRPTITLGQAKTYAIQYPASIINPLDDVFVVTSETFTYNGKVSFLRNKLNSNQLQVINASTGESVVDNIGSYDAINGVLNLVSFAPSSITSGNSYIEFIVTPANQSVINPVRNQILKFDNGGSFSTATITNTR